MSDARDKAPVDAPVFYGLNEAAAWAVGHAAGWDAAVAARPVPDRETIAAVVAATLIGRPLVGAHESVADAILALLTTDTTKED